MGMEIVFTEPEILLLRLKVAHLGPLNFKGKIF